MPNLVEVRKTYKYRLYRNNKVDGSLHHQINVAGIIWNHALALQKRYYKLTRKYIPLDVMKKHIAKLRKRCPQYAYWKDLGSQAVQEILERLDKAYARFFNKKGGLPRFKKVKKFKSFILKQAGWDLLDEQEGKKYRKIRIGKNIYTFVYHRPLNGEIKTVAIKRDATGRLWLCFSVIEKMVIPEKISTDKIGGFDFGLIHFLTTNEGATIESPQYYKRDLSHLRAIQSRVSRKVQGSNNHKAGMWHINRHHIRIADNRLDFHFQLAHHLCDQYDVMVFEDLNLDAIKRLWGRKISDLGFAQFVKVLDWVAFKRGKRVVKINRWERTTGKCSNCGHTQKLDLPDRVFQCQNCGHTCDLARLLALTAEAPAFRHGEYVTCLINCRLASKIAPIIHADRMAWQNHSCHSEQEKAKKHENTFETIQPHRTFIVDTLEHLPRPCQRGSIPPHQ